MYGCGSGHPLARPFSLFLLLALPHGVCVRICALLLLALLVATNSLGLLVLVVSVLSLHLLDEGNVLLLGFVGAAVRVLDGLFPGGLLCLALLYYEVKVSWRNRLFSVCHESSVRYGAGGPLCCDSETMACSWTTFPFRQQPRYTKGRAYVGRNSRGGGLTVPSGRTCRGRGP